MTSVTVRSLPDHHYTQSISDGRHDLVADERPDADGEDLGPNPYELLLAALGACTSITLQMYAERKQWPLEEVNVSLTHEKVPPDAGEERPTDLIHIELSFRGDLTPEQIDRLVEISQRCPMHRTLDATPKMVTTLVKS